MANYLERVASSAGRRATMARPPNSGPPVLPPGKDLSLAAENPFASDQDQFLDPLETPTPAPARSAEIASPKREVTEESRTTPRQDPKKSVSSAVPETRPPHERLTTEPPLAVTVPRTLRPISTPNVPPIKQEPASIIHSTDLETKEVNRFITTEPESIQPTPTVTEVPEKDQAPLPAPRAIEVSDITPIPRVDRVDGPGRQPVAEPSPPPVSPVHVPPVMSSATKQEQSRITIGSLEVLVNNHPRVTPSRPAPTPSRTERLNLEKRYLDRFRLRH